MSKSSFHDSKLLEVHFCHEQAIETIKNTLEKVLPRPFVALCIGTDRCLGDCLGPLIGYELMKNNFPYPVYGTLEDPIHAMNLKTRFSEIKLSHPDLPFLAIDASLGKFEAIGDIQLRKGPIFPGKGVGKDLPRVGDYSLIGIVDAYNPLEELTIHQIRLYLIHSMAQVIAQGLLSAVKST
ncbi:spore protease YyaC [Irregularibacter muris]|uniref:Spore protease YyaC n=1 Tax=Irregularibacter muris TaxID=1796619 RepID=A0AAE3HDA8_9FIRM|nr:spore protease YyaC [Irregularibacter muris]MCR1898281.1 spore protease YyaC [Irregularibacter muris]